MNRIYLIAVLMMLTSNLFSQMRIGEDAAELSLPDQNGKIVSLSDLKGKVVLIDFWASWCGPCRHNNPHLLKLYNKFHDKGFEIYGISLDEEMDSWRKAVHHDRLSWIQVIDDKGWEAKSASKYGVDMIPASFLLDKQGVVRAIDLEGSELESNIRELLKD